MPRDRALYRVTLFLSNGGSPQYTCRAETPEAAVRKIRGREEEVLAELGIKIQHSYAEELGGAAQK